MNRGKRGKVLNEVKPVENIRMYRVFLREVLRKKKKSFLHMNCKIMHISNKILSN